MRERINHSECTCANRGEDETKLVFGGCAAEEVVRETGIHNTPISRSAATLSGVQDRRQDAPRPGCILGRNYGVSFLLIRSWASLSVIPLSYIPAFSALRSG